MAPVDDCLYSTMVSSSSPLTQTKSTERCAWYCNCGRALVFLSGVPSGNSGRLSIGGNGRLIDTMISCTGAPPALVSQATQPCLSDIGLAAHRLVSSITVSSWPNSQSPLLLSIFRKALSPPTLGIGMAALLSDLARSSRLISPVPTGRV